MIADDLFQSLKKIDFTQIDCEELLDNRDLPEFDGEWMRIFTKIESIKKEKGFSEKEKAVSNNIRERVYLEVWDLVQDGDIAGYISDDFGLICDSELVRYRDEWLDKLISAYQNLQIPNGIL